LFLGYWLFALLNLMDFLKQFLKYSVVGAIAFIFDFGILFLLTHFFAVPYLISATISFIVGVVLNYILSLKFVFKEHTYANRTLEFTVFAIIGVVGLGLNDLFLWLITEKIGLYYLLSKILTTVIVFFWNFSARKFILFYKRRR